MSASKTFSGPRLTRRQTLIGAASLMAAPALGQTSLTPIEIPSLAMPSLGYFPAPVIKTKGIFSENGHAEVWLSDDENHIVVQMKSKVSFGSLSLYLKNYKPSPTTNVPLNRVP